MQNSPAEVFLDHAKLEKEKERLCWQGAKSFDREGHPARKMSFKGLGKVFFKEDEVPSQFEDKNHKIAGLTEVSLTYYKVCSPLVALLWRLSRRA